MASPNGPQPGSQQDDQTINNKKKCFRSNYRSLIEALPIDELIPSLYQESIITSELKDKIEAQQTHEERARVFLEEAIQRGLDVGYTKSFDQLIEVMSKSDNVTAQYLAQKLKCCCKCAKCGADISPENEPPTTAAGTSEGYFRVQDLVKIGKATCQINTPGTLGTGVVGRLMIEGQVVTVLLTCHTLLADEQTALNCQIRFHYIDADYSPTPYAGMGLFQHGSSQKWFWTSPPLPDKVKKEAGLNYTMVRIDKEKLTAIAYKDRTLNIQPFDLTRVDDVTNGDQMIVLHHPEGREKMVSMTRCGVVKGHLVECKLDTSKAGSTGSPVFKESRGQLQLVALLHGDITFRATHLSHIMEHVMKT
ncbi:uncharacterized protein [Dysidea avara]|uniref:uncharacterized protein n=1 Tax=Dysidea avara TaxID=196820 RepID=UPI003333C717